MIGCAQYSFQGEETGCLIKSMATRHFNEKFAQYNIVFLQELLYQYSCFKNIRIKRIIGVLCKQNRLYKIAYLTFRFPP